MSAEPYVPDETELIDSYAGVMDEYIGQDYDQAKADAMRGIAKIKADALREAADDLEANIDKAPNKTQRRHMQYAISMLGGRATRMDFHARNPQGQA